MHHSHNIDDFRPPYGEVEETEDQPDYITPAHIDSLRICLDSIHKAFDAFIEMPISTLRCLPTLFFVRNSYAAVALVKIYTAISAKGSKFGSVFKPDDLKVEHYLDAMIDIAKRASDGGQSRIATKFTFILGMLKSWQAKRAAGGGATSKDPKTLIAVKNANAEWETQARLGQNLPDSKTAASWNAAPTPAITTANPNAESQPSGLQMLSEVAMGNNRRSSNHISDPAAAALAATDPSPRSTTATATAAPARASSAAAWDAQFTAYTDMQPLRHHINRYNNHPDNSRNRVLHQMCSETASPRAAATFLISIPLLSRRRNWGRWVA